MPNHHFNRLQLGPIVGHTTDQTVCIWIQTYDNPEQYQLRIQGHGLFPFVSTENGTIEFGTATANAAGLIPEKEYQYQVLRQGRVLSGAGGSFQTMPAPGSIAHYRFVVTSCSAQDDEGIWPSLLDFVLKSKPRFLLLLGDQVYLDDDHPSPDVWDKHLDSSKSVRRKAMARKYQENWSREPVKKVLANIPTYMLWDDHEIRDGWGSLACDSPTLAGKEEFKRGRKMHEKFNAYFEDARDVYWHFQMCHNPSPFNKLWGAAFDAGSSSGRMPMPYSIQIGRSLFVFVDARGGRDLWREAKPVLGTLQWDYLNKVLVEDIPPEVDAVFIATQVGIAITAPDGMSQNLVGHHTEDVEYFKKGDENGIREMLHWKEETGRSIARIPVNTIGAVLRSRFGTSNNIGSLRSGDLDDLRDQWSNHFSRPEQKKLIKLCIRAVSANRPAYNPRSLMFLAGDLHIGAIYEIELDEIKTRIHSMIASGISKKVNSGAPQIGILLDEKIKIMKGVNAKLKEIVNDFNFGIVDVIPGGNTTYLMPVLFHSGNASAGKIALNISVPGLGNITKG